MYPTWGHEQLGDVVALAVHTDSDAQSTFAATSLGGPAVIAPLAMAILDRLVDGAIVLKIEGRSYRAHRSRQPATAASAEVPKARQRRESTK